MIRPFFFALMLAFTTSISAAQPLYLPRSGSTQKGVDLSNRTVLANGGGHTFNGATFRNPGGARLLAIGENAPAIVTVRDGVFDGSGMSNLFAAATQIWPGSKLTLIEPRMIEASMLHLKQLGGELEIQGGFIGAFGVRSNKDSHLEALFVDGGRTRISRTVFDPSAGADRMLGGKTGILYFEASSAPIQAELDGVTITGVKALKLLYPIQVAARPFDATITVRNAKIQRGSSGYFGITQVANGRVRIVDGGGNTDLDSGRSVDVTWPKRSKRDD